MKKIIHLISSINRGGAEKQMINLINNDQNRQHYIVTLIKSDELKHDLKNQNVEIHTLNITKKLISKILIPIKLYSIIKKINADVIFCWMYHSCLISSYLKLIKKIKIYWLIRHGSPYLPFVSFKNLLLNYLLSFLSFFIPEKIIYNSNYSLINHNKFGFNKKNSYLIYNGYDPKKYIINSQIKLQFKNNNKISDNYFLIGFLARYHKIKNHELLFRSLKILVEKYPDFKFKLLLAGKDINYKNPYLIEDLKKNLIFNQTFLFDKIENSSDFFNKIDLQVSPSINESFPNVICESLLCGVDSIISDVGAVREILINNNMIIKKLESKKLAKQIYNYCGYYMNLKDKKLYSKNLQKITIDKFNNKNLLKKFEKILE